MRFIEYIVCPSIIEMSHLMFSQDTVFRINKMCPVYALSAENWSEYTMANINDAQVVHRIDKYEKWISIATL